MCGWSIFDLYGRPGEGADLYCNVLGTAANRRKSYLPSCGGQFGGAAVHLGTGCGYDWRKSAGNRGNVDLYSAGFCRVRFI